MCESTAYLLGAKGEERIMDNVIFVLPTADGVFLEGILGEQITVKGKLKEIKLLDHKIMIDQL